MTPGESVRALKIIAKYNNNNTAIIIWLQIWSDKAEMNAMVQGSGDSNVRLWVARCSIQIGAHTSETSYFAVAAQRKNMDPHEIWTLIDYELSCFQKGLVFWCSRVGQHVHFQLALHGQQADLKEFEELSVTKSLAQAKGVTILKSRKKKGKFIFHAT
jgi:hypothetical protein